MNSVISNSRSLKNQTFTPSGYKDLGIRTFKCVEKTQFLSFILGTMHWRDCKRNFK